jgi:hypothetical protein
MGENKNTTQNTAHHNKETNHEEMGFHNVSPKKLLYYLHYTVFYGEPKELFYEIQIIIRAPRSHTI